MPLNPMRSNLQEPLMRGNGGGRSDRGGGSRGRQHVMRRNQLYSIETSIRTAIPPKDYKPPVDPAKLQF